eukprot:gene40399-49231_t
MSSKVKKDKDAGGSKSKDKDKVAGKETKPKKSSSEKELPESGGEPEVKTAQASAPVDPAMIPFEAGRIFSKYDADNDGKLSKQEFTHLLAENTHMLGQQGNPNYPSGIPKDLVSNRILTHFDETAGVAIPRFEVDSHVSMGHVVKPLVEAYSSRYEHLRSTLTNKLYPKREYLLNLKKQLQHTAIELSERRKAIERETLKDTENILERLKGVESLRQSNLEHHMISLDEQLSKIERIVQRVERANAPAPVAAPTPQQTSYLPYPYNTTAQPPTSYPYPNPYANPGTLNVQITPAWPANAAAAGGVEAVRAPRALDMVEVIRDFSSLTHDIEALAMQPVQVQMDFSLDDFPRET